MGQAEVKTHCRMEENREIYNYTILGISSLERTYDRYERTIEFYEQIMREARQTGLRYERYADFKEALRKAIERRKRIDAEIRKRYLLLDQLSEPRSSFCYKSDFF